VLESLAARPLWYLAGLVAYALFLLGVAIYDLRHRRIPNVAVYPAILAALGFAFVRPDGPWWSFVIAGLVAGAALALLAYMGGMGFGDVKLAAFIGLMTGWPFVMAALFVAAAGGAIVGFALMATGRIGRREPIAFGPALAGGALVGLVAGPQVMHLLVPPLFS
jgi:prepilin signal peptidase PulO-like enzyme (type II secretory pathway)